MIDESSMGKLGSPSKTDFSGRLEILPLTFRKANPLPPLVSRKVYINLIYVKVSDARCCTKCNRLALASYDNIVIGKVGRLGYAVRRSEGRNHPIEMVEARVLWTP